MGHEPEKSDAEIRALELQRDRERRAVHDQKEQKLLALSDRELPQAELRRRSLPMIGRIIRITSLIPASLTLHLQDYEGKPWDVSGGPGGISMESRFGAGEIFRLRRFLADSRTKITVAHRDETITSTWNHEPGNSERELQPMEQKFAELIPPLEAIMNLGPLVVTRQANLDV